MDAKSFGVFLAQQRKKQGFTQAELAEQLHVTDKAVSRWERGIGLPDINTLEPLANALQMTLDELIHAEIKQERSTASAVQAFCRFVFSTISICLANNTFNLFYPFCSSLHSCTRTLPRQCCHSMEGQFFCCPHSLRRKIRGVSRFGTIGSGHICIFGNFVMHTFHFKKNIFLTWCYILHPRFAEFVKLLREANFPVLLWLSYPFLCTYDPVVKYSSFLTLPNSNKNPAT